MEATFYGKEMWEHILTEKVQVSKHTVDLAGLLTSDRERGGRWNSITYYNECGCVESPTVYLDYMWEW